jgi:hypothetical protein
VAVVAASTTAEQAFADPAGRPFDLCEGGRDRWASRSRTRRRGVVISAWYSGKAFTPADPASAARLLLLLGD